MLVPFLKFFFIYSKFLITHYNLTFFFMSSMATLKRHLPISGPEGLNELRKIVERFEEKIYSTATSQFDYL
ncbi:unnamed protein product, partial [Vitis vinifera]